MGQKARVFSWQVRGGRVTLAGGAMARRAIRLQVGTIQMDESGGDDDSWICFVSGRGGVKVLGHRWGGSKGSSRRGASPLFQYGSAVAEPHGDIARCDMAKCDVRQSATSNRQNTTRNRQNTTSNWQDTANTADTANAAAACAQSAPEIQIQFYAASTSHNVYFPLSSATGVSACTAASPSPAAALTFLSSGVPGGKSPPLGTPSAARSRSWRRR